MMWRRHRPRDPEIAPDEIFLDAANTPSFDRARFEGRLERPLGETAFAFLSIALVFAFILLLGQAWNLQVRQGSAYAAQSACMLRPASAFSWGMFHIQKKMPLTTTTIP